MSLERTLVFLKPDALKRCLVGEIISRFEKRGFFIAGLKMVRISKEFACRHYAAHEGKDFYEPLIRYVTSGASLVMVLEGKGAIRVVRSMLGETFGGSSTPGTIRGDFALSNRYNLIHASDSADSASREIGRFFDPRELVTHTEEDIKWIYDISGTELV